MAKGEVAEIATAATVMGIPDYGEYDWQTDHVEAARQIGFETEGDTYIGKLVELVWIDSLDEKKAEADRWFLQAKFEDPQGISAINCGYELRNYFAPKGEIDTNKIGHIFRIELKRLVDVDQNSPMLSFRIDIARPRNADTQS